jgi:hypothetical protein
VREQVDLRDHAQPPHLNRLPGSHTQPAEGQGAASHTLALPTDPNIACCCGIAKRTSRASAAQKSRRKAGRIAGLRHRVGSSTAAVSTSNTAPALLGLTRPSSSSDATFSATLTHFPNNLIAAMSLGAAAMSSSQLDAPVELEFAVESTGAAAVDGADSAGTTFDRR